jgi:hypothetical protein
MQFSCIVIILASVSNNILQYDAEINYADTINNLLSELNLRYFQADRPDIQYSCKYRYIPNQFGVCKGEMMLKSVIYESKYMACGFLSYLMTSLGPHCLACLHLVTSSLYPQALRRPPPDTPYTTNPKHSKLIHRIMRDYKR